MPNIAYKEIERNTGAVEKLCVVRQAHHEWGKATISRHPPFILSPGLSYVERLVEGSRRAFFNSSPPPSYISQRKTGYLTR